MKTVYNVLLFIGVFTALSACKKDTNKPEDEDGDPKPVAAFACIGPFGEQDSTRFTNSSSNAVSYLWNFGDGTTSTARTPAHVFRRAGRYTVKLKASGAGGVDSSATDVVILAKPLVSFWNMGPSSAGDSMHFQNRTIGGTSYLWDFGDGGTSTRFSAAHRYQRAGRYTVRLRATGSGGSAENTMAVNVFTPPRGYTCNCKVYTSARAGNSSVVRLPDEDIVIGGSRNGRIEFKNVSYDSINEIVIGGVSQVYYRSTVYAASMGGDAKHYPKGDSINVSYYSGGIAGGGSQVLYKCKIR
ncbi:PKD domain-containing protein [Hymenobacter koreensis]|uniref:PKD domain-containing protein n=1 Tax=Hymenobacter koreensis TaxID=1084523 RepID=A0ABP8IV62_9BACT